MLEILDNLHILQESNLDLQALTLAGVRLGSPAAQFPRASVVGVTDAEGRRLSLERCIEGGGVLLLPGGLSFTIADGAVTRFSLFGPALQCFVRVRREEEIERTFGLPDLTEHEYCADAQTTWTYYYHRARKQIIVRYGGEMAIVIGETIAFASLPEQEQSIRFDAIVTTVRKRHQVVGTLLQDLPQRAKPPRYPLAADHVRSYLSRAAAEYPERVALANEHSSTTYRQLAGRAEQFAGQLRAAGLPAGSTVGLLLPDHADFAATLFGTWLSGHVAVPLRGLEPELRSVELKVVVVSNSTRPLASRLLAPLDTPPAVLAVNDVSLEAPASTPPEATREEVVLVTCIHRRTERAWAQFATNQQLLAQLEEAPPCMQTTGALFCPHDTASAIFLNALLASVRDASTLLVQTSSCTLQLSQRLWAQPVSAIWASAQFFRSVVDEREDKGSLAGSAQRLVAFGAMRNDVVAEVEGAFAAGMDVLYGPPEGPQAIVSRAGSHRRHSVGQLDPAFELKVVQHDDREQPIDRSGRLLLRSPLLRRGVNQGDHSMHLRWGPDGWFDTGDFGYVDDDGYVFIVDSCDPSICRGDHYVHPDDIENRLHAFPQVEDVCVFRGGELRSRETVNVALVLRDQIPLSALHRWLSEQLSPCDLPDRYAVVDELPRNPTGRVLRRKLIGRRHQMVWHDASQLDRAGQTLTPRLDPPVAVLAERILRLVQKRGLERAEHDPGRNRMDSVRARVKVSSVDCQRALEHLATLDGASVEPRRFALDEIVDVTIPNA